MIGRKLRAKLYTCFSKLYDVTSFVPQKSKLGALLFVNDIENLFDFAKSKMCAGDLTIYACY